MRRWLIAIDGYWCASQARKFLTMQREGEATDEPIWNGGRYTKEGKGRRYEWILEWLKEYKQYQ